MFKKLSALSLALIMIFSFAGCQKSIFTEDEKKEVNIIIDAAQEFVDGNIPASESLDLMQAPMENFTNSLQAREEERKKLSKEDIEKSDASVVAILKLATNLTVASMSELSLMIDDVLAKYGQESNTPTDEVNTNEIQQNIDELKELMQ